MIATCSNDHFVVWDTKLKQPVRSAPMTDIEGLISGPNCGAAFSPDGTTVAFGVGGKIRLFSLGMKKTEFEASQVGQIKRITYTSDGKFLVAFQDGETTFLDPSTGETVWTTLSGGGAISANAKHLVGTNGSTSTIEIWDIDRREITDSFDLYVPLYVGSLMVTATIAVSPDATHVATILEDHTVRVWDTVLKREVFALTGRIADDNRASPPCIAYSPDGLLILTCASDGTVQLWDAKTGDHRATLKGRNASTFKVTSGAFSGNSRFVVTSDTKGDITLWDASPVKAFTDWNATGGIPHASLDKDGHAIPVFSPKTGIAGGEEAAISMRDVRTGAVIADARVSRDVYDMQVCQRDNRVLILSDGAVEVRDRTLSKIEFREKMEKANTPVFSPDCSKIAFVDSSDLGNEVIRIFSTAADGKELSHFVIPDKVDEWDGNDLDHMGVVGSLTFSNDGNLVVVGIDDTISIMDATNLKELKKIEPHRGVLVLAVLSPDNHFLVSAAKGGASFVWSMEAGKPLKDLAAENVVKARFSKDGERLVTVSGTPLGFTSLNRDVAIWDTRDFEQVGLVHHSRTVEDAAFTQGRDYLLTTAEGGEVRMTALYRNLDELVAHSKTLSVRDLRTQASGLIPRL